LDHRPKKGFGRKNGKENKTAARANRLARRRFKTRMGAGRIRILLFTTGKVPQDGRKKKEQVGAYLQSDTKQNKKKKKKKQKKKKKKKKKKTHTKGSA